MDRLRLSRRGTDLVRFNIITQANPGLALRQRIPFIRSANIMVHQAQIASKLGISPHLDTIALAGHPQVSDGCRDRIHAAASEISGYCVGETPA